MSKAYLNIRRHVFFGIIYEKIFDIHIIEHVKKTKIHVGIFVTNDVLPI